MKTYNFLEITLDWKDLIPGKDIEADILYLCP
jgi:hypothetical protein